MLAFDQLLNKVQESRLFSILLIHHLYILAFYPQAFYFMRVRWAVESKYHNCIQRQKRRAAVAREARKVTLSFFERRQFFPDIPQQTCPCISFAITESHFTYRPGSRTTFLEVRVLCLISEQNQHSVSKKEVGKCQLILSATDTYPLTKLFGVYHTEKKAPRNLYAHQQRNS